MAKKTKGDPVLWIHPLRMRLARQARGLTLFQAAKQLNLPWALLARWERERSHPWDESLATLARVYRTTAAWLTGACAPNTAGLWADAARAWAGGEPNADLEKELLRLDPPGQQEVGGAP